LATKVETFPVIWTRAREAIAAILAGLVKRAHVIDKAISPYQAGPNWHN
jgi:hypothetical protein